MHVYHHEKNTWENLLPNGGENLYHNDQTPRTEAVMCHDRAQGIIVVQSPKHSTEHYDIKSNTWTRVLDPGEEDTNSPPGHDAHAWMYYDPFSQRCLLFDKKRPEGIWVYSSKEKAWTRHTPNGPQAPTGKLITYFDEQHNVFVVNSGNETWVYRFKK